METILDLMKGNNPYLNSMAQNVKSIDPFVELINPVQDARSTMPDWLQTKYLDHPEYAMQIFAPGVNQAIRAAGKKIPKGLTTQDMANMKARIAAQNQTTTRNSLGNMANAMGGAANPAFALSAARMRAGAGANTAASMANVNIAETRNNQALQMQRRGQMADAAKLGLGYGGQMQSWWQNLGNQDVARGNVNLQIAKQNAWTRRTNADMLMRPGDTPWGGMP